MLNDGRAGAYFQPRANTGPSLTASGRTSTSRRCLRSARPLPNAASIEAAHVQRLPTLDADRGEQLPGFRVDYRRHGPVCVGFANLHSWSFSEDGGTTAAEFNDNSNFHFSADVSISAQVREKAACGSRRGTASSSTAVSCSTSRAARFACFGGTLPFYSFTANHGITYVRGTTVRLEVFYNANDLIAADPATIHVPRDLQWHHLRQPGAPLRRAEPVRVRSLLGVGHAERRPYRRLLPAAANTRRVAHRDCGRTSGSAIARRLRRSR